MSTKIGLGVEKSIPDKQDKKSAAKIKQLEKELQVTKAENVQITNELQEIIAQNERLEKEIAELQGQLKTQPKGDE